ncbi:phage major capsid protein [Gordonia rhizosphera]|uniref:Phage capsid-like C-terminal domain-containing protein n=1 Tax=Gordonia rhizosphera NBRC 16068 TaxID=1108045 RepID=K6W1W8_9ACTN|nr:phage major capsid protein [Gordonia rhizosphera]GAB93160.1 hypothetical protein GORHZ_207_00090 [Gordonia rhizosphera NBRC 16068]
MTTQTTSTSATGWSPDVVFFPPQDAVPEAVVLQTATNAGPVEGDAVVVRVPYVDDAEAGVTAEGDEIQESDPTLDEAVVYTAKVTQLVRLSREQWTQPSTATQLASSVRRAIVKKADALYLAAPDPDPELAPVLGLALRTDLTAADGTVDADLDYLVDLIAALEAETASPSVIVVDPVGWADLQKIKRDSTDSNEGLLGAGTMATERRLLSLPVLVNSQMPAATGLVIDKNEVVAAIGQVAVATSDQALFQYDSVLIRATMRFGFAVPRPERIGVFNTTSYVAA